jgi:hypothetical protein
VAFLRQTGVFEAGSAAFALWMAASAAVLRMNMSGEGSSSLPIDKNRMKIRY